jgi:hypothetical protein
MKKEYYLMRLLSSFFEELAKTLGVSNCNAAEKYDKLYTSFLKMEKKYFLDSDLDTISAYLDENTNEHALLIKTEILAELLLQEANVSENNAMQRELLLKSLFLFEKIEAESDTFSFERLDKIADIKNRIEK